MDEGLRAALRDEIEARGLPRGSICPRARGTMPASSRRRASRSAMLFVRSLNGGVSHSPDELSSAEDVALGVEVLTSARSDLFVGGVWPAARNGRGALGLTTP